MNFTETKTGLKIYEGLTAEEYAALTKEPHSFYIVEGVGVYKGETLIAGVGGSGNGSGGATIINKTLSGSGENTTIESFTEEEINTLFNDKSAIVVGTYENGAETLIFTQQEQFEDSSSNIFYVSLVSYYADSNYYWRLVVGKMQGQLMAQMSIVENTSGGLTEEEVNTLINNKISVVVNDDDTIDLTIN